MRRLRFNGTNVLIYILGAGEKPISGEICFAQEELVYAERLAMSYREKEDRDNFWQGIFEQKKRSAAYTVFDNFPREAQKPAYRPRPEDPPGAPKEVAQRYLNEILQTLGRRSQAG